MPSLCHKVSSLNTFNLYQMILSSLLRAAASERVLTKPTKLGQLSRDVVFQ